MQTCHRQLVDGIATQLAVFVPAAPLATPVPAPYVRAIAYVLPTPHPAPLLRRPDAPS
jgi:hypothetical protein